MKNLIITDGWIQPLADEKEDKTWKFKHFSFFLFQHFQTLKILKSHNLA